MDRADFSSNYEFNPANSSNEIMEEALRYARLGWSVIPLGEKDKKSLIE